MILHNIVLLVSWLYLLIEKIGRPPNDSELMNEVMNTSNFTQLMTETDLEDVKKQGKIVSEEKRILVEILREKLDEKFPKIS